MGNLDDVARLSAELRSHKAEFEAAKRREYEEQSAQLKVARDLAVIQAHKAGESKASIARAMGTQNRSAVYAILDSALTKSVLEPITWTESGDKVQYDFLNAEVGLNEPYTGTLMFERTNTGTLAVPDDVPDDMFTTYVRVATFLNNTNN